MTRTPLTLILLCLLLLIPLLAEAKVYRFLDTTTKAMKNSDISIKTRDNHLQVSFQIDTFETKKMSSSIPYKMNFMAIEGHNLFMTQDEGRPSLPYYSILVNKSPSDLLVEVNEGKEVVINDTIPSPQYQFPNRCGEKNGEKFVIDFASYQRVYPLEKFSVESLGDFRGVPVSRIKIYPVHYNGEQEALYVNPSLNLTVKSRDNSKVTLFEQKDNWTARAEGNQNYLIITPKRFRTALKTFISWKENLGFLVEVVDLESIGTTFAQIKSFIAKEYETNKYSYALLVGDENIFPTDFVRTSASSKTPSDLKYFTMGGESDIIPDIYAGRMVVASEADIINQTKKIIEYEKGKFEDDLGLTQAIGIASAEGYNPSDVEYVLQTNKPFEDKFETLFNNFFEKNSNATPQNINSALSSGAMWVTYLGHGSGYAWASLYGSHQYRTTDIKNIDSKRVVRPIVVDVACLNGRYLPGRFGERFMNEVRDEKPIGAVAYYGGSVSVSWHPPAIMARGITKKIVEKDYKQLGESLLAGQLYLAESHSNQNDVKDNFAWYHLFGDPSLFMRLSRVKPLIVEKESNIFIIKDEDRKPIEGAKVVVWGPEGQKVYYSDKQGQVETSFAVEGKRHIVLAQGHEYYESNE